MEKGMNKRGEITVFLSLCILCVFALLAVMAESVRMAGSRYYFQTAVGGALDSLFSCYHRKLWEEYRVLGLPCESDREAEMRLLEYAGKYLEAENWYPIKPDSVEIAEWTGLADQGGDWLTQEVLDYMKFGVWGNLEIAPDDGVRFLKDLKEAAGAGKVTDAYEDQTEEVRKLERVVEKIAECAESQEKAADKAASCLAADDASGFRSAAADFRREAKRMDGLVEKYEKQAEKLEGKLRDTRKVLEEAADDWQENRGQLFAEQMNPFEAYVSADGSRRREILDLRTSAQENLVRLEQTEQLVSEAEKELEEEKRIWLRELYEGEAESAGPEPTLSLVRASGLWADRSRSGLKLAYGKGDEEKRGFLEQVKELVQNGLAELVLPADMQVSAGVFAVDSLPSRMASGSSLRTPGPVERVLLHEYCGHFFVNALSGEKKPLQYEMEYLLGGKSSDRENLEEVMGQLLLIRQGLNLIHILSDSAKRNEARGLAAAIVGVTGLAPLVEIMACFIMVVWAAGEAVMDLRTLFAGGKVPLWKNRDEWKLSLEGLLNMGKDAACPGQQETDGGLDYENYLKLLLFLDGHQELQLRMMDLMDINLQREEDGFTVMKCVYRMKITGRARGEHLFFRLPVVTEYVEGTDGYPLEAPASRAY